MNIEKKDSKLSKVLLGLCAGVINGLFGGGGGLIIVALLTDILKKPQKKAQATAMLIILPLSIISAILYLNFVNIDFGVTALIGIGVLVGGVVGAFCLKKLSNSTSFYIFYGLMFFAGLRMLF